MDTSSTHAAARTSKSVHNRSIFADGTHWTRLNDLSQTNRGADHFFGCIRVLLHRPVGISHLIPIRSGVKLLSVSCCGGGICVSSYVCLSHGEFPLPW